MFKLRRAIVSYWPKYVQEVLVNRLGGLRLPRKSVVRLTDRPDVTIVVYRGRKTTTQQQQQHQSINQPSFLLSNIDSLESSNSKTKGTLIRIIGIAS